MSITLKAAGVTLPGDVTSISVGDETIWSSNAGRSPDSGKMLGDIVAKKKTVEVEWSWLTESQLSTLRSALNDSAFFSFVMTINGTSTSMTCYRATIESQVGFVGSDTYYKSVKTSFIQQ